MTGRAGYAAKGINDMRKWLILLVLLLLGAVGVLWWLGQSFEADKPEAGEVRTEIEHVF